MTIAAPQRRFDIKIGIATAGRARVLADLLVQVANQRRLPDELIVCPASADDCDERHLFSMSYPTRLVRGGRGLVLQRNAILDHCGTCDILVFLDDDFYPSVDFLERLERIFATEPSIVGVTGRVLSDGAVTAGIAHEAALAILDACVAAPPEAHRLSGVYNLYGCNMAVRMQPVREHGLRFDENLPLYGWLEDVDFTRRVGRYGRLVKSDSLTGVHLASKRGRSSGIRIGYSQISNPLYLVRKGTMGPGRALRQIGRNIAANVAHFARPEPWVDRRGRLRGNAMAAIDLLRGQLDPRRVLVLDQPPLQHHEDASRAISRS